MAEGNEIEPSSKGGSDAAIGRRRFLTRLVLGLSALPVVGVSIPILGYLLSPLIRPAPEQWIDVGPATDFKPGETVLRSIADVSPLPWAGQTAQTAAWVRRTSDQAFTVFAVNCTHLGCPVKWQPDAEIFLCPCHGGVYNADGSVAGGPPPRGLFMYEARVQNGTLQVKSRPLGIG